MAVKPLFRIPTLTLLLFLFYSLHSPAQTCVPEDSPVTPNQYGFLKVERADQSKDRIFWAKLKSQAKEPKGTLFYLAGGPLSHYLYLPLAKQFQILAFPDYDVVLYDYYGFNCSGAVQDFEHLKSDKALFTLPAMAKDFHQLKRQLVGEEKVFIMGGSHGGMLGAEILSRYPGDIAKAILYSSQPQIGWFKNGWHRFDDILAQKSEDSLSFSKSLRLLLKQAEDGQLTVDYEGESILIDRPTLELSMWISLSQSSTAIHAIEELVKDSLQGETQWLLQGLFALASVSSPPLSEEPPTLSSEVINLHRCNIWYPASTRSEPLKSDKILTYAFFRDFWSTNCAKYDELGEFPAHSIPSRTTDVPLLVWIGDLDYFDPTLTELQFSKISTQLTFKLMHGWSHDFGQDTAEGIKQVSEMIREFLAEAPKEELKQPKNQKNRY